MNLNTEPKQAIINQDEMRVRSIGYMPGLDGLRTLAVFAVIAYHLGLSWIPGGLLGVNLFFVLSGYLITDILIKQWEVSGSINLKSFWLRRVRRLLPALLVMLAGVILWAVVFAPDRLAALRPESLAAIFYASNWYLIFHEVSYFESFGPPSPLGHLWSLAIEGQFYLLWPIILCIGSRWNQDRGRRRILIGTAAIALISAVAMALIYVPGYDPSRVYYGTDTRAFALLIGAMLAMLIPSGDMPVNLSATKKIALDGVGLIGLIVILWMFFFTNQYQPFLYRGGLLLFSLAGAILVAVLAHPESSLARLFGWSPLRLIGKWSYGIYLWHYPVIILSSPRVNAGEADVLLCIWQIVVSVILAALSYYLIEEPIRNGKMKPLLLSARVSVSMLLLFAVMFITASKGIPISAHELEEAPVTSIVTGEHLQGLGEKVSGRHPVVEEQNEVAGEQAPPVTRIPKDSDLPQETELEGSQLPQESESQGSQLPQELGNITIIGDSLMIDLIPVLQENFHDIVVDAEIGRQMYDAPEIISDLKDKGKLGEIVIIGLGTNGAFTEKQLKQTLDCLEEVDRIILLNTRVPKPWEAEVNKTLSKVVYSYPNAGLVDWHGLSSGHEEYFYSDGVHLNKTGAEAYIQMLSEALAADLK